MNNVVVKLDELKKIYITDILGRAKNDEVWSVNERKLAMLVFSQLSEHRIYGKDLPEINSIKHPDLQSIISNVNRRYSISRDEFKFVTGVSDKNLAREIRVTSKALVKRDCDLPNPFDINNEKSFNLVQYFSGIRYNDTLGTIHVTLNEEALPYILYLNKYTILLFKSFYCIRNKYSLHIYMYCKIFQNKYTNEGVIVSDLDSFKKNLGVDKKYSNTTTFKTYVLDVVKKELNNKSDLHFDYELYKTGKRFTDITLKFSQKKNSTQKLDTRLSKTIKTEHQLQLKSRKNELEEPIIKDFDDQTITVAIHLQAYGIPKEKALEYVSRYGVETCNFGIEKLINEISKGKKIKNTSGYLIKCIENSIDKTSFHEIKAVIDVGEQLKQDRKAKELSRFNNFDTYIETNKQDILVLLARHEVKEQLVDELEIDMLRCLKEVFSQYNDLVNMTYVLKLRFKGQILNYGSIKSLVNNLKVATKEERIAKLKSELEIKKLELIEAGGQAKGLVDKEITILKVAIADLV